MVAVEGIEVVWLSCEFRRRRRQTRMRATVSSPTRWMKSAVAGSMAVEAAKGRRS